MKIERSIIVSFVLLVLIASLYRLLPGRPLGFAPQIAMALFSGSIIKNKRYSFLLPILSMLLSDILFELLFQFKISILLPTVGATEKFGKTFIVFVELS